MKLVNQTHITCTAPAQPASSPSTHSGGRGITHEKWTTTNLPFDRLTTHYNLSSSDSDYLQVGTTTSLQIPAPISFTSPFTQVLKGYFVSPLTGECTPILQNLVGQAAVYLSTDSDPANKVSIVHLRMLAIPVSEIGQIFGTLLPFTITPM